MHFYAVSLSFLSYTHNVRIIEHGDDALECELRGKVAQIQSANQPTNERTFCFTSEACMPPKRERTTTTKRVERRDMHHPVCDAII